MSDKKPIAPTAPPGDEANEPALATNASTLGVVLFSGGFALLLVLLICVEWLRH